MNHAKKSASPARWDRGFAVERVNNNLTSLTKAIQNSKHAEKKKITHLSSFQLG